MKCKQCGHELDDKYAYCRKCGAEITVTSSSGNGIFQDLHMTEEENKAYEEQRAKIHAFLKERAGSVGMLVFAILVTLVSLWNFGLGAVNVYATVYYHANVLLLPLLLNLMLTFVQIFPGIGLLMLHSAAKQPKPIQHHDLAILIAFIDIMRIVYLVNFVAAVLFYGEAIRDLGVLDIVRLGLYAIIVLFQVIMLTHAKQFMKRLDLTCSIVGSTEVPKVGHLGTWLIILAVFQLLLVFSFIFVILTYSHNQMVIQTHIALLPNGVLELFLSAVVCLFAAGILSSYTVRGSKLSNRS